MSLRTRVVALIGLVLIVGVLLGSVLAGLEARRTLRAELQAAMAGGRQTVLSAFEDLPRSDHASRDLHQLVTTFNGNRHVRARLVDSGGRPIESSTQQDFQPAPRWFSRLLGAAPQDIGVHSPPPTQDRVIVLQPIRDIDVSALWAEFVAVMIALGVTVAGGLTLVYLLIDAALRPLRALSEGFVRIGAGDYRVRVASSGPSDLIELQRGFNAMGDQLTAMSGRNRALEAQLITLQDEERADLARDLHDEIGPHLFAVNVDAEVINQLLGGDAKAPVAGHLRAIQASVGHMQRLVRDILGRLRPSRATELGLNVAVRDIVTFWEKRSPRIEIACALLDDEDIIDEALKDTVYRVIQESLNNAVRHAGASHIAIRVAQVGSGEIEVSVTDDGSQAIPPSEGGFGILGMRERVSRSGGAMTIGNTGQSGWSVVARLPLKATSLTAGVEAES